IGCIDTLSFGAECADAVVLQQLSRLFQQSSFDAALKTELSRGVSYPAARAAAAENFLPNSSTALNGANNILGIEYLAACRALHFAPQLAVLPRQGAAHDAALEQGGFASASALREALYKADCACGAIYSEAAFSRSLLSRLRCMSKDELSLLPAAGGEGLANRLHRAAKSATSAEELYALVKSKRYTHARVRRLVLEAYLALPPALPALPPYLRVLGASDAGLCLLREAKGTASLPLCFSLADAEKFSGAAGQVAQLTARGD
ncbi:MAG: nucleotidyltransferase family protein, partial [Pygmaiobacter sp.]